MYDSTFGAVRPLFFLVSGWLLATGQVLRHHTAATSDFGGYLLFPVYVLFYQVFVAAACFLLWQRHIRRDLDESEISCGDYKQDTIEFFGFLKHPTITYRYTVKLGACFLVAMVASAAGAYYVRHVARPATVADSRRHFIWFATGSLCLQVVTYVLMSARLADALPAEEWTGIQCIDGEEAITSA